MDIIVNNRIRVSIDGNLPLLKEIKKRFKHHNPAYYKQKNMGYFPKVPQYLETWKWDNEEKTIISFPRGAFLEVISELIKNGIDISIIDERLSSHKVDFILPDNWQLRPYQEKAVQKILKYKTCLIQGAAGSGKTEIVLGAIAKIGLKALVIVPDGRVFNQWVERAQKRLGLKKEEIGTIGNKNKFKIGKRLTIATQQAAWRRPKELYNQFSFVILDEAHHAAAKTYMELLDAFVALYRVGVSATLKRQDAREFLTHDLFGPIAYKISRTDMEELGFLQAVDCIVIPTNFEYDYMNKVKLTKICEELDCEFSNLTVADRKRMEKRFNLKPKNFPEYCSAVAENSERNKLIAKYVLEEINQKNRCLIFTNRRVHCEIWKNAMNAVGIEIAIFWGGSNSSEEKRIEKDLKRLQNGEILVGIGTVVDEAINLPAVEAGFVCQRAAQNNGQLEQQAGRLARTFKGKAGARLYYFWDKNIPKFEQDVHLLEKQFTKVRIIWPTNE